MSAEFIPPFRHTGYTVVDSKGDLFAIVGPAQGESPNTTALAELVAKALNEKNERDSKP